MPCTWRSKQQTLDTLTILWGLQLECNDDISAPGHFIIRGTHSQIPELASAFLCQRQAARRVWNFGGVRLWRNFSSIELFLVDRSTFQCTCTVLHRSTCTLNYISLWSLSWMAFCTYYCFVDSWHHWSCRSCFAWGLLPRVSGLTLSRLAVFFLLHHTESQATLTRRCDSRTGDQLTLL